MDSGLSSEVIYCVRTRVTWEGWVRPEKEKMLRGTCVGTVYGEEGWAKLESGEWQED